MAHIDKTAGHYDRVISNASKQLAALPGLCLSKSDLQELKTIYKKQIRTAMNNRDTATALNITVIDPEYL